MITNQPAQVFPPGEFVREELEARGWTQADLASVIGRPVQLVNLIVTAKKAITPRTAGELAAAFGTSPELWLNLQSAYALSQETGDYAEIQERARLYQIAPIKLMKSRGWIGKTDSIEELHRELAWFYDKERFDELPTLPLAARSSAPTTPEAVASQVTWGYRVRQLARGLHVAKWRTESCRVQLPELRQLASHPEGARKVPRVLAAMGIRFVVVEHLPKTRMDGCAIHVDNNPIIGMSLRYDRIDCFWHTLVHELAHVLNGDSVLDDNLLEGTDVEDADQAAVEARADSHAADMLVPKKKMASFMARVGPLYSKGRINQFANLLGIHPGIIVGQLQHLKEIPYSKHRDMLVPVRDIVCQEALTDGWGHSVSLS